MVKSLSILLMSLFGSALAAPAIVWKKDRAERALRTSEEIRVVDMLSDVLDTERDDSQRSAVVFLLGRGADGSESFSTMAAAGSLPNVGSKYNNADCIHHHVSGIESADAIVKDAKRANPGHNVLLISFNEFTSTMTSRNPTLVEAEINDKGIMSKTQKYDHKRTQELSGADVLIVEVPPTVDTAALDSAVTGAIDHDSIANVVLTAVRSHDEVKQERLMEHNRRLYMMKDASSNKRRRLEDQQQNNQGDDNQNNGQNNNNNGGNDMTGVYYVSMTPNILAGILFTLLFVFTTYLGVTCMGMIAGQDVYVKKMPPVGREA